MEQDPGNMHQAFSKDTDCNSDASSYVNSLGVSSGRMSNVGSFGRGSFNLSRGASNTSVFDEVVGNGARHRSVGRRGSRGSGRRSSSSLSRDVSDQILRSISLSRDLAEQILGDVDSSVIAQVGDSGDRVTIDDRDDEKGSLVFSMDDVGSVEKGFRSGSHLLTSPSPVAQEIKSPLPTDAMLHSTEKNQLQKVQDPSLKDHQYKLHRGLDYIFYLIHLSLFGILGVNTKRCTIIVSGVQLGFLGCMSTVSTFVAEVYAMRESRHSGRALAYAVTTILPSFAMAKHYK